MSNTFSFSSNLKKWVLGLAIVGLVLGIGGSLFFDQTSHHSRFWANLLLNTYYFAGIAITGVFFVTAHQLGYGGWHTVFKKIPIAMGRFLFIAFFLILIIVIGMWISPEGLYSHWADPSHRDSIVQGKAPFLTRKAYSFGVLLFFGLWAYFAFLLAKKFKAIRNWKEYSTAKKISAAFLFVFGISSSVLSWWVIMSLDPHWYSTLFGWYNLASYFCAGFAMMILIVLGLKKMGYLPNVTVDHVHDIAKLMFGFSIFWTYLWFSQFLLIWYPNVPETTAWYSARFEVPIFKFIFFGALLINFVLPLLAIIKRDAKRNYWTVGFVSVMLIFGHYLDFFQMVMVEPMAATSHGDAHDEHHGALNESNILFADAEMETHGHSQDEETVEVLLEHEAANHHEETSHSDVTEHAHVDEHADVNTHDAAHGHSEEATKSYAQLGFVELMFFIGFLGLFLFMTFTGLDGDELETKEDPFLEESLHHHIKFS